MEPSTGPDRLTGPVTTLGPGYTAETWYVREGLSSAAGSLAALAWEECAELQVQTQAEFVQGYLSSCTAHDTLEVLLHHEDTLVGAAILVEDHDMHVGRCLSLMWQYVHPEHRNCGFARYVLRLQKQTALQAGYRCVSYSHRLAEGRYSIQYRRV